MVQQRWHYRRTQARRRLQRQRRRHWRQRRTETPQCVRKNCGTLHGKKLQACVGNAPESKRWMLALMRESFWMLRFFFGRRMVNHSS